MIKLVCHSWRIISNQDHLRMAKKRNPQRTTLPKDKTSLLSTALGLTKPTGTVHGDVFVPSGASDESERNQDGEVLPELSEVIRKKLISPRNPQDTISALYDALDTACQIQQGAKQNRAFFFSANVYVSKPKKRTRVRRTN